MSRPADTQPAAWLVQREILRRMTASERLLMAMEMSDVARAASEAGIRHRHPDWTDEQVREALSDLLLGTRLASTVRRARLVSA